MKKGAEAQRHILNPRHCCRDSKVGEVVEIFSLDKSRNSLAKYCYDLSKIIVTIAIINPIVTEKARFVEIISGLIVAILFLAIAI